jgi:hypothetical protein
MLGDTLWPLLARRAEKLTETSVGVLELPALC